MVETLGPRAQFLQLKKRISITDSIRSASKGKKDGSSANPPFCCTLPTPERIGTEYPWVLSFPEIWYGTCFYLQFLTSMELSIIEKIGEMGSLQILNLWCCFWYAYENQWQAWLYTMLKVYIKATGEKSAEMVTDEGAIYLTSNKGYNWRAAVQETVSATLNRFISYKWFMYLSLPCLEFSVRTESRDWLLNWIDEVSMVLQNSVQWH